MTIIYTSISILGFNNTKAIIINNDKLFPNDNTTIEENIQYINIAYIKNLINMIEGHNVDI